MSADQIWAAAVRATRAWVDPNAEKVAELGRLVIRLTRAAIDDARAEGKAEAVAIMTATWGADLATTQAAIDAGLENYRAVVEEFSKTQGLTH